MGRRDEGRDGEKEDEGAAGRRRGRRGGEGERREGAGERSHQTEPETEGVCGEWGFTIANLLK